jgi:hypothetical protein
MTEFLLVVGAAVFFGLLLFFVPTLTAFAGCLYWAIDKYENIHRLANITEKDSPFFWAGVLVIGIIALVIDVGKYKRITE